jgi:hypothetical protein
MNEKHSVLLPKDVSSFCHSSTSKTVVRESTINTIKHYLKSNTVIILEGDANIGKTTVLSQICELHYRDSIVFFSSKRQRDLISDAEICKDLYLQLAVFMQEDELDHAQTITLDDLNKKFNALKYFLKIKNKEILFVLDGILDIEGLDDNFVAHLFLMMPFESHAKFIISTKGELTSKYIPNENRQKITLSVLDENEISKIIPSASQSQTNLIMETFNGMPDRIATFARLVENGKSIEELLNETSDAEDSIYSIEWALAVKTSKHELAIAFIVYSFHELGMEDMEHLLNLDAKKTESIISEISFIKIENDLLKLSSNRFVSFSKTKLGSYKLTCIDDLIEYFDLISTEKRDSPETVRYIEAKGDKQGVIDHIDDSHIYGLFKTTSSLSEVNRTLKIGIKAALDLEDDNSVSKLSHLNVAFTNINKSRVIVSELNCYLAEGDNVKALDLIESNGSNEEKLQLYCLYCISQKKNKNEPEKQVLDKINFLYQKFENRNLGVEKATDIAADLLPIFPDKALKIINNLDEFESAGQNKSDSAFYKMSVLTLQRHGDALGDDLSAMTTSSDKRTEMFNSVEVFSPDSPSDKIINHVSKMEEVGDRIFIFRSWLKNNYERKAAVPIFDELIKLATETTDFSIDASLYADATLCLTVSSKNDQLPAYNKIVTNLGTLKEKGPTIEYVKLIVNLCIFEKRSSIKSKKIDELIDYLLSLADKSVALVGLTIVSLSIKKLERIDLETPLMEKKNQLFKALLQSEAYHIDIFKDAIANEAVYDFNNALLWCSHLNSEKRSSKAYSIAVENFINRDGYTKNMSFEDFIANIRKIKVEDYREDIYELVIEYYFKKYASNKNFSKFEKFLNKIKSNLVKSRCQIKAISGEIKRNTKGNNNYTVEILLKAINESIQKTDSIDNQMNLYFRAHKELYPIARESAIEFKLAALKLKNEYKIATSDLNEYLYTTLDLTIRCIYQLEEFGLTTSNDIEFILDKISLQTSNIDKCYLYARLASSFQKRGSIESANSIVEKYILTTLNSYNDTDCKEYAICCYNCLPVIFYYDYLIFETFLGNISSLYTTVHERIIYNCGSYIMNDTLLFDPFSPPPKNKYRSVKYKDLNKLVKLISKSRQDDTILFECKRVLDALAVSKKSNNFTSMQTETIVSEIKEFYERFPVPRGIQHLGYRIILQCYIKKFDNKAETSTWDELITETEAINNISDRSFMLAEIAKNLPDKATQKRQELFSQSEKLIETLSSNLEKLNRYTALCENSLDRDKSISKHYLKKALELCAKGDDSDSKEARLNFIDMINRFDDSFSSSMVNMFDDDPARRKSISKSIQSKKNQLEFERKFNTNELDYDDPSYNNKIAKFAWENLGSLNAKNGSFKKGFDIKCLLTGRQDFSIDNYYRIYSYYIHYLSHVFLGKDNRKQYIRPLLSLLSANILTVNKVYKKFKAEDVSVNKKNNSKFLVVTEDNKGECEDFLHSWFTGQSSNELTLIDPYFDRETLNVLSKVIEQDPDINLTIVANIQSRNKLLTGDFTRIEEVVYDYWKGNVGQGQLPVFKFIFIHYGSSQKFPFHDRHLYTPESMIWIGTSLNGLGSRKSQIKILEQDEMLSVLGIVEPTISEKQRYFHEDRIKIVAESF